MLDEKKRKRNNSKRGTDRKSLAIFFLNRDGNDFKRQKSESEERFEERDPVMKFAVENTPCFVDVLLTNNSLIGGGHGL